MWPTISTGGAAVADMGDCTVLSGIAEQNPDDSYLRRGSLGSLLNHNKFSMYLPDGTNVYGSRGREFEGIGRYMGF